MTNLKIYCITDIPNSNLDKLNLCLAGVGQKNFPHNYITCQNGINIQEKEKYYSELTFHYWFWKNKLMFSDSEWIGFCQKRRFWVNKSKINKQINKNNFDEAFLTEIQKEWENYDSVICKPIFVNNLKKSDND